MSKKLFISWTVMWIILVGMYIHSAVVQEQNVNLKKVNFQLEAGDKIYIVDKSATSVRLYCTPKEAKKYYLKVPEGKIFEGTWTLR